MPRLAATAVAAALAAVAALAAAARAAEMPDVAFCSLYHHEACAKPRGPCDQREHCRALVCFDTSVDGNCAGPVKPDYCAQICGA